MKKNRTTKIAIIVLALVLATSCFVGATFAKYVTSASAGDTARVAKWGVELTTSSAFFEPEYAEDVDPATGTLSVLSDDDADVVAPGTTGNAILFTITGAPEVDVEVVVNLGALTMVTLPVGEYLDYTTADSTTDTYEIEDENYYPVVWTLEFKGEDDDAFAVVAEGNLQAIDTYLENTISGKYEVEDADFATIVGEYKLTWDWAYEDGNDQADTTLGQIAAGVIDGSTIDGYVAEETFEFTLSVTQVD